MATYTTLGHGSGKAVLDEPEVKINVDVPNLTALVERLEKKEAEVGSAGPVPVVNVAPPSVNVYPEIKLPDVAATFNVPVPVVTINAPDIKIQPISVDLLIPKLPFVALASGVYGLLAVMIYVIIALHFPEVVAR